MTEPKQWAIEQHIKKNPKCEWLCTHINQHNLGEVLEDSTEPAKAIIKKAPPPKDNI